MLAKDIRIGQKYESTAFKRPVKIIAVDEIYEDGTAKVTVLYYGKLYTDFTFGMSETNNER